MAHVATLVLFKKHVHADDFTADDDYLYHLLDAAEETVIRATNRTVAELEELGGGEMPHGIIQAIFMLGAHWYNQRESVSTVQMHEVPASLQALVKPYRKLADDKAQ